MVLALFHTVHYGAPTRLLDWTDGALIALYFPVKSQGRHANAAVWMLDPVWLNHEVMNELDENNYVEGILLPDWSEADPWFPEPFESVLYVPYPVAIDPPHVARRVSVQRSRFTVHGKSMRGLDALVARMTKPRLVKFVIPKSVGRQILKDLSTCGIMQTSAFPDLVGLSKELETKWTQLGFGASAKTRKAVPSKTI
jgi:FRG domain